MKLSEVALNWALRSLLYQKDGDIFPFPFEFDVIQAEWDFIVKELEALDIENYNWNEPRGLFVLKQKNRFRKAAQYDPIDSIILMSIIKDIGEKIEIRRIPTKELKVFSYRFVAKPEGRLYKTEEGRSQFRIITDWHAERYPFIVRTDLVDFYNQIYHHTLENQINECEIQAEYKKALKGFIHSYTKISRGIPIGPHATHLLAELFLIPVDNAIMLKGIKFCRYVDDILLFCNSHEEALIVLHDLTQILDGYKLVLNQEKTKIFSQVEYAKLNAPGILDDPINEEESEILQFIKKSSLDTYDNIEKIKITPDVKEMFSEPKIIKIFKSYLKRPEPNYPRLQWFLKRLSQTGIPSGINFIINNIKDFFPVISEAIYYISNSSSDYAGNWADFGEALLNIINSPIVVAIEYLQMMLMHSFTKNINSTQIPRILKLYNSAPSSVKREIVLAACHGNAADWLRMFKDNFQNSEPWLRRAILYSMRTLPSDERDHWLYTIAKYPNLSLLEKAIIINCSSSERNKNDFRRLFSKK